MRLRQLGVVLIALGLCAAAFGMLWDLGLVPGSRVVLPAPVALSQPTFVPPTRVPTAAPAPPSTPVRVSVSVPFPTPGVVPLAAADATERDAPFGTYAVRLTIPSIKVD